MTRFRLPELPALPDRGCKHHPVSCFTCPFAECVYGEREPGVKRDGRQSSLRHEVLRRRRAGESATQIADAVGLNRRSVYRHLVIARELGE